MFSHEVAAHIVSFALKAKMSLPFAAWCFADIYPIISWTGCIIQCRNRLLGGGINLGCPTHVVVNGWPNDVPHDLRFDDKYDCRLANNHIEIIVAEGAPNIKQALIHTESFSQSLADNGLLVGPWA